MRYRVRFGIALLAVVALVSCRGGGSSSVSSLPPTNSALVRAGTPVENADWSTFGYDLPRTGFNINETSLGISSFGTFHAYWTKPAQVGYHMQGEPVLAAGVTINGLKKNVLYAGGGKGMFYAFNANNGAKLWSKQLGATTFDCTAGHVTYWGVEGTAVLDRPRNRIYVPDGANQVHALDLSTGAEAAGWPVSVAPLNNLDFIHNGLNYNPANGYLYVGTSSVCDVAPWHGSITAIDTATGTIVNKFLTVPTGEGGGIWGYGGASIDPQTNNVFVATGNSVGTPQYAGYAEHVIELSADLKTVIAQNHPTGMPPMPNADFGTTPMLFQPVGCDPLMAVVNKSGAFLLYDRLNIGAGPVQMIDMSIAHEASFRQVPAWDPVTGYVYVAMPSTYGIYLPGLAAFSIQNCQLNPTPMWNAVFGPDGSTTTAEATRSGISIANGVVYISGYTDKTTYAFNAATGAKLWSAPLSGTGIVAPIVWNGHLYVGDMSGAIHAWTP
jgi:outer membrane protein assembly factor BamB